jgi:hypothetical protein
MVTWKLLLFNHSKGEYNDLHDVYLRLNTMTVSDDWALRDARRIIYDAMLRGTITQPAAAAAAAAAEMVCNTRSADIIRIAHIISQCLRVTCTAVLYLSLYLCNLAIWYGCRRVKTNHMQSSRVEQTNHLHLTEWGKMSLMHDFLCPATAETPAIMTGHILTNF